MLLFGFITISDMSNKSANTALSRRQINKLKVPSIIILAGFLKFIIYLINNNFLVAINPVEDCSL